MTARRVRAAVALALLVPAALSTAAVAGPAAWAADERTGVVESVVPGTGSLDVDFLLTGLASGDHAVPGSVEVKLDGKVVSSDAAPLVRDGAASQDLRRVALLVDVSGSMAGPGLAAARAAVQAYVGTVPADVEVALVTFAGHPNVVTPPTKDRATVAQAAGRLVPDGGTSLYDGVLRAQEVLGAVGERRILVLSDGADTSSTADLDDVSTALQGSGITLDAMLLGPAATNVSALTQLSAVGQGRMFKAQDNEEAVAAFTSAAQVFSEGLSIRVATPDGAEGPARLRVRATTTSGAVLSGTASVLLPDVLEPSPFGSRNALLVGLAALFVGLVTALVLAVGTGDQQAVDRRRMHALLAGYSLVRTSTRTDEPVQTSRLGTGSVVSAAVALAGRLLKGDQDARLAARLDRASVRLLPREWLVLQAVGGLITVGVGYLVGGLLLALVGLTAVLVGSHLWLNLKGSRRQAAFNAEMPDALQLVASGLASGYSFAQAVDSVVREGRPPVAEEFGRALAEARLGVPLEDALETVATRMDSKDFHWVVMAIRVQRDVGGNLSEVLQTVCNTMRERAALRRQVKALSAEGRLSAVVLTFLPVLVGGYLALMNPVFFAPMIQTGVGQALLLGSAVSLALGGMWMKKLVKVEM